MRRKLIIKQLLIVLFGILCFISLANSDEQMSNASETEKVEEFVKLSVNPIQISYVQKNRIDTVKQCRKDEQGIVHIELEEENIIFFLDLIPLLDERLCAKREDFLKNVNHYFKGTLTAYKNDEVVFSTNLDQKYLRRTKTQGSSFSQCIADEYLAMGMFLSPDDFDFGNYQYIFDIYVNKEYKEHLKFLIRDSYQICSFEQEIN